MGTTTVNFTLSDANNKTVSLKVEDIQIIKRLIPNIKGNSITTGEYGSLVSCAAIAGNTDTLEFSDISGAKNSLKSAALTGNAKYNTGIGNTICQAIGVIFGDGAVFGDEITISNLDKNLTLGELEKMYNLPDGALKHNYTSNKGNYKNDKCNGFINFLAEDFAKGNNMTIEDVKAYFGQ